MPKLTRLLVCGIAAAILTSPATPDLAWAVFVRTAPPPLHQAPSGTGLTESWNGLGTWLLPVAGRTLLPVRELGCPLHRGAVWVAPGDAAVVAASLSSQAAGAKWHASEGI
jgi:hypothetical protein